MFITVLVLLFFQLWCNVPLHCFRSVRKNERGEVADWRHYWLHDWNTEWPGANTQRQRGDPEGIAFPPRRQVWGPVVFEPLLLYSSQYADTWNKHKAFGRNISIHSRDCTIRTSLDLRHPSRSILPHMMYFTSSTHCFTASLFHLIL